MSEKRYFEHKDELRSGLDFLIESVVDVLTSAHGEPAEFEDQAGTLIAIYQVLKEDIDNENLTDIDKRIEEFKSKATNFIQRIKPYCKTNEISKKQIN